MEGLLRANSFPTRESIPKAVFFVNAVVVRCTRNPAAVDASRVSLSRIVLRFAAASEVIPARIANLGCLH